MLLLGGSGTRLGSLTKFTNKHLLPAHRYTLAERSVAWLIHSGISRIIAVASPENSAVFQSLLEHLLGGRCSLEFVPQPTPLGTGDAVVRALPLCNQSQIVVLFGDNVFERPLMTAELEFLPLGTDVRCYTSFVRSGLEEFGYIDYRGSGPTAVSKPHTRSRGEAITGVFLVRASALAAHEKRVGPRDLHGEHDLMSFVFESGRRGALGAVTLNMRWSDAGHSPEALWRAGRLARTSDW